MFWRNPYLNSHHLMFITGRNTANPETARNNTDSSTCKLAIALMILGALAMCAGAAACAVPDTQNASREKYGIATSIGGFAVLLMGVGLFLRNACRQPEPVAEPLRQLRC